MTARAAAGLAVLAVLTAGCARAGETPSGAADAPRPAAETAPGDAVPWDTVDAFQAARRGSYTETIGITGGGMGPMTLMEETVRFDLEARYMERTVSVSDDMSTDAAPGGELRFVYTDTAMLMWHPNTVETCGTHWIDLTDAASAELTGADLQPGDLLIVEPLEFLAAATGEPRHLETTSSGSTYEITAPADLGFPNSSALLENPGAQEAIMGMDAVAEVVLIEAGTSLTISVDLTEAFRTIAPSGEVPEDVVVRTAWNVTRDIPPFATDLPADVADVTCMGTG
ncbi:hypothetical protein [Jiangella alba]|uniref:hypothetical protein n=1 Tax=Jiangella alba TaxID=561176 RepID=UPI00083EB8D4|nr:hypothetical protein [Jiangella alba]